MIARDAFFLNICIVFRVTVATTRYHYPMVSVGIDLANAFVFESETPNSSHYLVFLVEDHLFGFNNIENKVPSPTV